MNNNKFRQMEDEMSRFEAEISGQSMYQNGYMAYGQQPMLIPHQVKQSKFPQSSQVAVVTAKPTLYTAATKAAQASAIAAGHIPSHVQHTTVDFIALQNEVEKKLKKLKSDKVSADIALVQSKGRVASAALQSLYYETYRHRHSSLGIKNKKYTRQAGGQVWEDVSLQDWPDDDFRIFCGDLGNDVTDELLTRTFNKYPSFARAKVIRDKRTSKTKGYGFISFKDPADFTRAMKEMNGRYVGSRPIKLRKSTWKNRCIDIVKKKEKEKAALLSIITSGSSSAGSAK